MKVFKQRFSDFLEFFQIFCLAFILKIFIAIKESPTTIAAN